MMRNDQNGSYCPEARDRPGTARIAFADAWASLFVIEDHHHAALPPLGVTSSRAAGPVRRAA